MDLHILSFPVVQGSQDHEAGEYPNCDHGSGVRRATWLITDGGIMDLSYTYKVSRWSFKDLSTTRQANIRIAIMEAVLDNGTCMVQFT